MKRRRGEADFFEEPGNEPRTRIVAYDASNVIVGSGSEIKAGSNITLAKSGSAITITGGAGGSGHEIRENGSAQTTRAGLNFIDADAGSGLITDDAGGDETEVNLNLYLLKSPTGIKQMFSIPAWAWIPHITVVAPSAARFETTTNDVNFGYLATSASTARRWYAAIPAPYNWDLSTITFRVYWTAAAGSGNVVFQVKALARSDDDALDTAMGSLATVTDTLIATGDQHITAESGALTVGGTPAARDMLFLEMLHDPAHASDTFDNEARIMAVSFFYGISTVGVTP